MYSTGGCTKLCRVQPSCDLQVKPSRCRHTLLDSNKGHLLLIGCLPACVVCLRSTLWEGFAAKPVARRPTLKTMATQPGKSDARNTTAAAQHHYERDDDEDSYDREASDEYYRRDWPECWGSCSAGSCNLDQSRPGCCYLPQVPSRDHNSPYSAQQEQSTGTGEVKAVAQPAYRVGGDNSREGLICWDGEQPLY